MTEVQVRFFAAAREAAACSSAELPAATVGDLRSQLVQRFPDIAPVLTRCSLLSEGVRLDDDATGLAPGSVVDVLPPYAGG